jgi:hypothetical protein
MQQVTNSQQMLDSLRQSDDSQEFADRLTALLSHSDGIRGFFVSYLTDPSLDASADLPQVPASLVKAMRASDKDDILIPLVCMNVVMPTATSSMHKKPELAEASLKTAQRGIRVLLAIVDKPAVQENCQAIFEAATGSRTSASQERFDYWCQFFVKWGYKDQQKSDIARVMTSILGGV